MAIIIHTDNPSDLLKRIRLKILNGVCKDWEIDADGDFTLSSLQYGKRAWLHVINDDT